MLHSSPILSICEDCELFACLDCVSKGGSHSGHSLIKLENIKEEEYERMISEILEKLSSSDVEKLESKIELANTELSTTKEEFEKVITMYQNILDHSQKNMQGYKEMLEIKELKYNLETAFSLKEISLSFDLIQEIQKKIKEFTSEVLKFTKSTEEIDIKSYNELRVIFIGLDGSGKTTALYKFKLDESVTTIPTIGFNVETVVHLRKHITIWDVGGQDRIRPLWRHYYSQTNAVVFFVDSNDKDRISEACNELHNAMSDDQLGDCILLIFANKQDLPCSMNTSEITEKLKLNELKQTWFVQPCTAMTGEGLKEGFDFLVDQLKKK